MHEHTEHVSAISSREAGSSIVGPSEADGKDREDEREPVMEEENAASSSTSSISSVTNPPPENHLVTFEIHKKKNIYMHKCSHECVQTKTTYPHSLHKALHQSVTLLVGFETSPLLKFTGLVLFCFGFCTLIKS